MTEKKILDLNITHRYPCTFTWGSDGPIEKKKKLVEVLGKDILVNLTNTSTKLNQ